MFKRVIPAVLLVGLITAHAGAVWADDVEPVEQRIATFVGAWVVSGVADGDVIPPFTNVSTVNRDGSLVNSDPDFGTGVGVWRRIGPNLFVGKFVTIVPDDAGFPPGALLTVESTVTVADGSGSATGPYVSVIEHPDIGELLSFTGTVSFDRITLGE